MGDGPCVHGVTFMRDCPRCTEAWADTQKRKPRARSFTPGDLIFGALVVPYGAFLYAIGGWSVALETSAGIILAAIVWICWRVWHDEDVA